MMQTTLPTSPTTTHPQRGRFALFFVLSLLPLGVALIVGARLGVSYACTSLAITAGPCAATYPAPLLWALLGIALFTTGAIAWLLSVLRTA